VASAEGSSTWSIGEGHGFREEERDDAYGRIIDFLTRELAAALSAAR